MSENISYTEAAKFLKSHDNYYILIHSSPDGDAVGSGYGLCFALREMGKKANVLCSDPIPEKYEYIMKEYEPQKFANSCIISTDLADTKLLGKATAMYADFVELAIDHHISNTGFAKKLVLDGQASSACEIVYDILKQGELPINPLIASCLFTGIETDTGCFKFECTTPRCHEIAAEIIRDHHIPFAAINRTLFDIKSLERIKLEQRVMEGLRTYLDGKCAIAAVTLSDMEITGAAQEELEGVASLPMCIKGVSVGVTIKEKEPGKFKISMRSAEDIDVSEICRKFGGGGHIRAAGCTLEGDVDSVRLKVLAAIAPVMGIDLWLA